MSTPEPFRIDPTELPNAPLSVTELNRLARETLESRLPLLWVAGEISNLTAATSGHFYFTLKDTGAQVRCVMFRSRAQLLGWRPENGQKVEARALVTLYEARGDYQLNVESLRRSGTGKLYEEFVRLKLRLEREGLFEPATKRPLPRFPRRIGIVSSPRAAALRDVVTTLRRRAPQVELIVYPTAVQGTGAAAEIVAALGRAARRQECDLLILCRGGGSIEDLWSFNDEAVARAIRTCCLPVIAGIGHETDFTIADFAADLRAPTPTAAAEQAAPSRAELATLLAGLQRRSRHAVARSIGSAQQTLDYLSRRLLHPAERIVALRATLGHLAARWQNQRRQLAVPYRSGVETLGGRLNRQRPDTAALRVELQHLDAAMRQQIASTLTRQHHRLAELAPQLRHLDPNAVLQRGYAIATEADGKILRDAGNVEPGTQIVVNLWRGRLCATVDASDPGDQTRPG